MNMRDVVISGLGLVSPHGDDPAVVFDALLKGRSAIAPWSRDGTAPAAVASVDFSPARWLNKLQLVGVDRVSQMAVAAAELAKADACWPAGLDGERIGVFIGSGMGGASALEDGYEAAKLCALNLLACAKLGLGDLDRIDHVISVSGYVNCVAGFPDSPKVINGASDLLVALLGDDGRHVRAAVGVAGLPVNSATEVQMIVALK